MFEHWLALDAGAKNLRLYDYSKNKEVVLENRIVSKNGQVLAWGKDSLNYLYSSDRSIQVKCPVYQNKLIGDIKPLIKAGFKELKVSQNIFRPCVLVCVNEQLTLQERQKWQQELVLCGVRKVEFVNTMDLLQSEEPCFIVHSGHSYTEIGIYAYQKEFAHKMIYFAGMEIDEQIKKLMAQKTNCLVSDEDAMVLKEMASKALFEQKNVTLTCHALDRFGKQVVVSIRAYQLWPAFEDTIKQIVLWVKQCYMNMGMEMQRQLMENGVYLSGGLARCFGVKQALQHELDTLIICTNHTECDIIEQMKGWK